MRLYPNLIRPVVAALQEIFSDNRYADKVIEKTLKLDKRWGARDRSFIAESTYNIVRWYRLLYEIKGEAPQNKQDWWEIVGIWFTLQDVTLPDWKDFESIDPPSIKAKRQALAAQFPIQESIPDWLNEIGQKELGDKWKPTLHALNEQAALVIRTNTLKVDRFTLQKELSNQGIVAELYGADALVLPKRRNLFKLPLFKKGWFEIQDASSQEIAPFLDVQPGMWVIDACAGAGGKALHIASFMKNKGKIFALDLHEWKLKELRKRSTRAGIDILSLIHI